MRRVTLALILSLPVSACIAPSVVDKADRARLSEPMSQVWKAASASDLPGVYVSSQLKGEFANVLRKVVYLFEADGSYSGAALVQSAPPHFEVIQGTWAMRDSEITLDTAAPAQVEISDQRSLRISGQAGEIILRRELEQ